MIIEICSRERALALASGAKEKTAVISITSKEEKDVVFPANENLTGILHLKFNDLTQEYDEEGIPYGRPLPKQEDFAGLRDFAAGLDCGSLIVHCWEGTSRSAAVAQAIYEYLGCRDELRTQQRFSPNPLVFRLACRVLGLQPGNNLI